MAEREGERGPDPAYRHVLVPLDGSDLAAGAIPTASALAERFAATVETISVADSFEHLAEWREQTAGTLGTDDAANLHMHVAVDEDPAGAIERCAERLGESLVCMATHGRGRVAGALIGSVARSVVERGRAPIVAVGPMLAEPAREGSVVTPLEADDLVACVDGGPESERVLPVAAAWAHALGMKLTIVTVAEPTLPPIRKEATWHRHVGPNADADAYVTRLADRWSGAAPGVRGRVVYDPIGAGDGMRAYLDANPTALLAVTTHARSGASRIVFGAGAAGIVHASSVPVLVVPLVE